MELTNLTRISICINNYIIHILLGQLKRCYWPSFKLETIEEVEAGMHPDEVAQNFNVSRSNVLKWVQQKKKQIDAAKSEYNNHLKIRRARNYVNLYKALRKMFKECRAKGYRISFAWLWSRAKTIYREELGDDSAIVKHCVIVNFIKRYNLQMRKKQQSKNVSKACRHSSSNARMA